MAGIAPFSSHRPKERDRLVWLEAGRAVAAFLVVLHHADQATAHFSDTLHERVAIWGQYGVDFFFVLSGFIIFHVHREALGAQAVNRLAAAKLYAFKRAARIYTPYLPAAVGYMALLMMFQSGSGDDRSWSVWATLTLLPMEKSSSLAVAWTLTYELIFYAFFLLVFVSRYVLFAVSLLWFLWLFAILGGIATQPEWPVGFALSNPIILEFFCGAIAALALPRIPASWRGALLAMGLVGLAFVVVTWSGQRVSLGPPLALIVLAGAMAPQQSSSRAMEIIVFLGAASYSLYLVHSPVISIVAELLQPLGQRTLVFTACVLLGGLAGVIYHVILERPLLGWVNKFRPDTGKRVAPLGMAAR